MKYCTKQIQCTLDGECLVSIVDRCFLIMQNLHLSLFKQIVSIVALECTRESSHTDFTVTSYVIKHAPIVEL